MEKVWVIIDDCTSAKGEIFDKALTAKTKGEAIRQAVNEWNKLSAFDQRKRDEFYVCLASYDEDGCIDWEIVEDEVFMKKAVPRW